MNPRVSIVVSCYNYGQYVAACLRSIQQQTFTDFEVVVVDDGSTDNSEQQIQPFLQDARFRYVKQENGGQAKAKNRGIREARAELVAFLDADDQWAAKKLELQLPLFANSETGVVFSGVEYFDAEDNPLSMEAPGEYLRPRRGRVTEYFIYDNFVPFSSVVVRKACFEHLGCFDESLAMGIDWDLWLRCSTCWQFDYCEQALLRYRIGHSGQMSKNLLERIRCADRIVAKFVERFPNALPDTVVKDAAYYSYCLRGYALRKYGIRYPLHYSWKAIRLFPLRKKAYVDLLKAPLRAVLGR